MNISTGMSIDVTSLNSDSKAVLLTFFFAHTSRIKDEEVLLTDGVEELIVSFFVGY